MGRRKEVVIVDREDIATKERKKKWQGKDVILLILIIIIALSIGTATWALKSSDSPSLAHKQTETPVEKLKDSIELPGFEWLALNSQKREQEQTFSNPEQNFCWIKVSLRLEDGTELWKSDLIAPGKSSAPVVLSKPLKRGEYKNALVKYECFRMDDNLTPLNGGEVRLTLKVS